MSSTIRRDEDGKANEEIHIFHPGDGVVMMTKENIEKHKQK
jgi:predicted peroxiredoxin